MKRIYYMTALVWLCFLQALVGKEETLCMPCGNNNSVYLSNQSEVNNFLNGYPGCTEFLGNITIQGPDITNLNGLINLTSISGNLQVASNPNLQGLSGLEQIISIGGIFQIYNNASLISIENVHNLLNIGTLSISNNPALVSLDGLNQINTITNIYIWNNSILSTISVLGNLNSINGNFQISNNPNLSNCCPILALLNTPGAISGTVTITGNATGCESQSAINTPGLCAPECTASFYTTTASLCEGDLFDLSFTGTPLATVSYSVFDGTNTTNKSVVLDENGEATSSEGPLENTSNSPTAPKTYTFSLIDVSLEACNVDLSGEQSIGIDVYNKPNVLSFSGPVSGFCLGESPMVNIDPSFFIANMTTLIYTVTDPLGNTSQEYSVDITSNPMSFTPEGIFDQVGTFTIRVVSIDNGVCERTTDFTDGSASVVIKQIPSVSFNATEASGNSPNDNTICTEDEMNFTAGGGTTYEFFINGNSQGAASTNNTFASTNLNNGDVVKVVVTNANGCSDEESVAITVNELPTATLNASETSGAQADDGVICTGDEVSFTAGGGTTYEFFINGNSQGAASTSNTFASTNLNNGDVVKVVVTNANGCSDEESEIIVVNELPSAAILPISSTTLCTGGSKTLAASTNLMANMAYQWYKDNAPIAEAVNVGLTVTSGGSYQVEVSNTANSCASLSEALLLIAPENMPVEVEGGACYSSLGSALVGIEAPKTVYVHQNISSEDLSIDPGISIEFRNGVQYTNSHLLDNRGIILSIHPLTNAGTYSGSGQLIGGFINQGLVKAGSAD